MAFIILLGLAQYIAGDGEEPKNITVVKVARTCYYIVDGFKSMFPDRYTLNRMGYEYHKLPFVGRDYINTFPDSPTPLKTLWDHHANKKFLALGNSDFILDTHKVFSLLNPSFIYWNDDIVVSWRTEPETFRVILIKRESVPNPAGITNPDKNILRYLQSDYHFLRQFDYSNMSVTHLSMKGEDPRIITTGPHGKQQLWVVFCKRYHRGRPELQMSYGEVVHRDGALVMDTCIDINFNNERPREDQKNWSPFEVPLTNKLLFVSSIDPHRVVDIQTTDTATKVFGKTLDLTIPFPDEPSKIWKWGDLRGGTPALLIDSHRYLAFFHSSNLPPESGEDVLKTYAMGAYTFCAKAPHKILSISSKPFIHESFYSGEWSNLPTSYYHIDYIVFPMSFHIVDERSLNGTSSSSSSSSSASGTGKKIYLLYGRRDSEGWVAKIDYDLLLSGLHTVNKEC